MPLPRHTVTIDRHELYADVRLHVGGRPVAETSLDRDVALQDPAVRSFVSSYFHAGTGQAGAARSKRGRK